jgi:lysozyme family protein
MSDFKTALKFVLDAEGGFDSDPDDHGGDTNFGIIQSEYNAYRKRKESPIQSVRFISQDEVEDIYFKEYWQLAQCEIFPWPLSLTHFDGCVILESNRP